MEPARDATVVGKLRDAGAVILGKLALDEYGIGAPDPATGFRIPALVARYLVGAGVVAVAISATLVPIPAAGGLALLTALVLVPRGWRSLRGSPSWPEQSEWWARAR